MNFLFSNLAGFWALLGIPLIVAIHFWQRHSEPRTLSTLFLLDRVDSQSVSGRRWDRWRSSIPFWMQIVAVLLLTWLLIQPRWISSQSVVRVVLLLDSSASMSAFRENLYPQVEIHLKPFLARGDSHEITVLETRGGGEQVFHGSSLSALKSAIEGWSPREGGHDFAPALRVGRSIAGSEGSLTFFTDHVLSEIPPATSVVGVGSAQSNVGFVGMRTVVEKSSLRWRVLVRNYSDRSQTRIWKQRVAEKVLAEGSLDLAARETRLLEGSFPSQSDVFTVELEGDAFFYDDVMCLVRPHAPTLTMAQNLTAFSPQWFDRLVEGLSLWEEAPSSDAADILWTGLATEMPPESGQALALIRSALSTAPKGDAVGGAILKEDHPLVEGLNWQGLFCAAGEIPSLVPGQRVLLWQGERPLISLLPERVHPSLVFHFDLNHSNVERLPAFIVLLHRFAESVRPYKKAYASQNLAWMERLPLAGISSDNLLYRENGRVKEPPLSSGVALRAPADNTFFSWEQAESVLFRGASHFAFYGEADLSEAASFSQGQVASAHSQREEYYRESFSNLVILLLLGSLLISWRYSNPRNHAI